MLRETALLATAETMRGEAGITMTPAPAEMARRTQVCILFRRLLRPPRIEVLDGPTLLWHWSQRPSVHSVSLQRLRRAGNEEAEREPELLGRGNKDRL
jgi:hypothetical protein